MLIQEALEKRWGNVRGKRALLCSGMGWVGLEEARLDGVGSGDTAHAQLSSAQLSTHSHRLERGEWQLTEFITFQRYAEYT